jgi:hypothetical protein
MIGGEKMKVIVQHIDGLWFLATVAMLTGVLSWQARNEKSVWQALMSPRVAPLWVAALLALGATVTTEQVWRALQEVGS